ncbi:MAG: FG-GAP repeat protein, partial [Planctomycetes bacterium]|nr:FG-GAP repeat protein [Planctomycetota bacterium]
DTLLVTAHWKNTHGPMSGAVYVFWPSDNGTPGDPSDDTWEFDAWLAPQYLYAADQFGSSAALSGNALVAGAFGHDHPVGSCGAAWVLRRNDNGTPGDRSDDYWTEEQKLFADDAAGGDYFGWSADMSGDTVVIGAYGDDDNGSASGSAYVFRYDAGVWTQEDKLMPSDGAEFDHFGYSVAVSGNLALIGADGDDDKADAAGSAYIFRRYDNGTPGDKSDDYWVQEDKVYAYDAAAGDQFGDSVALSAQLALVSAPFKDYAGKMGVGCAYLFRPNGGIWVLEDQLDGGPAAQNYDEFGRYRVSVDRARAAIGAANRDVGGYNSIGAARVFDYAEGPGDLNCDCFVEGFDIDAFVLALQSTPPDYPEYYAEYPDCDVMLADCNGDGAVNAFDIDAFIALLTG